MIKAERNTAKVMTKKGELTVDLEDADLLDSIRITPQGYAMTRYNHKPVLLHRLITGALPCFEVDHLDNNPLNNCKSNLRVCTKSENMRNSRVRPDRGTSRYKGVSFHANSKSKPWECQIHVNNKKIYLGTYATEEEAARKYNESATKHFGEFAKLNVIQDTMTYDLYAMIRVA